MFETVAGPVIAPTQLFRRRPICPACRGSDARSLFGPVPYHSAPVRAILDGTFSGRMDWNFLSLYLEDVEYCLLRCPNCTLVWQRDVPIDGLLDVLLEDLSPTRLHGSSPADLEVVRERIAAKLHDALPADDRGGSLRVAREHEAAADRGERRSKDYVSLTRQMLVITGYFGAKSVKVLDFGMGLGEWCRLAAAFGMEVFGLEYSEEKASWRVEGGYQVITPPALEDQTFDFINAEQVFEHLNEPLETLERLAGRLRPQGLIRIAVPNGYGIEGRLRDPAMWTSMKGDYHALSAVRPLRHINCFTGRSLTAMAETVGLKRVDLSLVVRLRSSIGVASAMKAPTGWMLRRALWSRYSMQYYTLA